MKLRAALPAAFVGSELSWQHACFVQGALTLRAICHAIATTREGGGPRNSPARSYPSVLAPGRIRRRVQEIVGAEPRDAVVRLWADEQAPGSATADRGRVWRRASDHRAARRADALKPILLVEDNADLAYGLTNNLEIEGYKVAVASRGSVGVELARRLRPDLVVLDLMLPDMDGLRLLQLLRAEGRTTPVLILTARGEEADVVRGLSLGADDYVIKPFSLLELLARIKALLRRVREEPPRPAEERFGDITVDRARRQVWRNGTLIDLTPKEVDLLLALLDRAGGVVDRRELLSEVWQYSDEVMSRTVDTHIGELRRKLEPDPSRPRHILTVRKAGYRLER